MMMMEKRMKCTRALVKKTADERDALTVSGKMRRCSVPDEGKTFKFVTNLILTVDFNL